MQFCAPGAGNQAARHHILTDEKYYLLQLFARALCWSFPAFRVLAASTRLRCPRFIDQPRNGMPSSKPKPSSPRSMAMGMKVAATKRHRADCLKPSLAAGSFCFCPAGGKGMGPAAKSHRNHRERAISDQVSDRNTPVNPTIQSPPPFSPGPVNPINPSNPTDPINPRASPGLCFALGQRLAKLSLGPVAFNHRVEGLGSRVEGFGFRV